MTKRGVPADIAGEERRLLDSHHPGLEFRNFRNRKTFPESVKAVKSHIPKPNS